MPNPSGTSEFEAAFCPSVKGAAWRYAMRLSGVREEAEDLLMDSIAQAIRRFGQLRDKRVFRSWLLSIIRTTYLNRLKRDQRRDRVEQGVVEVNRVQSDDPLTEAVGTSLEKLHKDHRELLVLFYVEEYSLKECAVILGMGVNAFRQKLYRARQELRKVMAESGVKTIPQIPELKTGGKAGGACDE